MMDEKYRPCIEVHPERTSATCRFCWKWENVPPFQDLCAIHWHKLNDPPGIFEMAANAVNAAARVVETVLKGKPVLVSEEEQGRRLALCRACEFHTDDNPGGVGRCRHPSCGCFTSLKAKLASERCPMTPPKWGGET